MHTILTLPFPYYIVNIIVAVKYQYNLESAITTNLHTKIRVLKYPKPGLTCFAAIKINFKFLQSIEKKSLGFQFTLDFNRRHRKVQKYEIYLQKSVLCQIRHNTYFITMNTVYISYAIITFFLVLVFIFQLQTLLL